MTRTIPAWEYLLGGLLWVICGAWVVFASALAGSTISFFEIPFGAVVLGVGVYWLWRYDRVHGREMPRRPILLGAR